MEVKPGYKQTEVGVIPEEWEVGALESVARIIDPQPDHRTPPETAGGEPYIGISDFIDYCTVDWDSSRKIVSRAIDKQLSSFQVRPGDIIFGKIGTIGSPKFLPTVPFRFGLSANVLLIQSRIEPNFVMSWLRSKTCQRAVTGELHSTSQAAFGINKMRRVMMPLPSEAEQRAIAAALSDADGLLGGLDRLIAKKRDLKQAAMQQLLTAQTRLPGFHGEWEVKRLGEIAHIKTGSRSNEDKVEDGQYPFFVRSEFVERINSYSHDCEAILVPGEGRIGDIFHYINGRFDVHQRVYAITKFTPDISGRFIHFYLSKSFGAWAMQNTVKATVDSLRLPTFQTFEMRIPPTKAEQTAIAEVLTEMDAELTALEQRREKTRALKQAMMQELLTGRTRLVASKEVYA